MEKISRDVFLVSNTDRSPLLYELRLLLVFFWSRVTRRRTSSTQNCWHICTRPGTRAV